MALKFLNKKGWHTGSLRNIENVWKAEQKHDAEQKKLEELRKQIQEERERSEFRLLQEQAGLVPRQERLDFLYESGLAVGKGSSEGFKALEAPPKTQIEASSSSTAKPQQASAPGALFEEKPQSANDAWRKLHSDPLLLIRQREQESLARIKNNPIQMAMIRKSVVAKKHKEETPGRKEFSKKLHHKKSKHTSSDSHFDSEGEESKTTHKRKRSKYDVHLNKVPNSEELREQHARRKKKSKHSSSDSHPDSGGEERETTRKRKRSKYDEHLNKDPNLDELREQDARRKKSDRDLKYEHRPPRDLSKSEQSVNQLRNNRNNDKSKRDKYYCEEGRVDSESARKGREGRADRNFCQESQLDSADLAPRHESHRCRNVISKLTHEERAARLREMQMDAELHEEQRWRRIKKAEHDDVVEANRAHMVKGRNFLDAAKKSVYGAEKGGSSTIEESVRRRSHYLQGRSDVEGNAFRR